MHRPTLPHPHRRPGQAVVTPELADPALHTAAVARSGDVGGAVAEIRDELDRVARRLDALLSACADPLLPDRLKVSEGPFEGDPSAALDTTRLWLERTRVMLTGPERALADAHVAAGSVVRRPSA